MEKAKPIIKQKGNKLLCTINNYVGFLFLAPRTEEYIDTESNIKQLIEEKKSISSHTVQTRHT